MKNFEMYMALPIGGINSFAPACRLAGHRTRGMVGKMLRGPAPKGSYLASSQQGTGWNADLMFGLLTIFT